MFLLMAALCASIAGNWIGGGATAFETDFAVTGEVRSATLAISGLGYYEAYLDGRKIGDKVLDPSPTDYTRRVLFSRYPIELARGEHTLRIALGHGWYDMRSCDTWGFERAPWRDRPKTIAELEITYSEGRRQTVSTDETWYEVESPIIYDCIREGEVVDGRKSWRRTGRMATVVKGPSGKLEESKIPATRIVREFEPQKIYSTRKGDTVVVFPKTISGWVRLRMTGQGVGDVVTIRYDENLGEDGEPVESSQDDWAKAMKPGTRKIDCYFKKSGAGADVPGPYGMQMDRYIARGEPGEMFEPRFVYHGFRYAVIGGLRNPLRTEDVRACFVRTDFPETGRFASSSGALNELVEMARQSYLANFANGFPTDCPHREKLGWCNDSWVASEMAQLYFENTSGYLKWLQDIIDTQRADGQICAIAPTSGHFGYEWGSGPQCDAVLGMLPMNLWMYRGSRKAVELAYPALKLYLQRERTIESEPWLNADGLGDWNARQRDRTPSVEFVVSCLCLRLREIASEFGRILGDEQTSVDFREEAVRTRKAIREKFRKSDGLFDNGRQTAQAMAIMFGLCSDEAERREAAARLVEAVEAEGRHFDGGLMGSKYIYRALSEIGRGDLALAMILNPTEPSMMKWRGRNGTLWEDWNDGFSKCHVMLSDFSAWAMEYVAGLRKPLEPGCRRYLIDPCPLEGLDWAEGRTQTPFGRIASSWRMESNVFDLDVEIPPGTEAEVLLPDGVRRIVGPGAHSFSCNISQNK